MRARGGGEVSYQYDPVNNAAALMKKTNFGFEADYGEHTEFPRGLAHWEQHKAD